MTVVSDAAASTATYNQAIAIIYIHEFYKAAGCVGFN